MRSRRNPSQPHSLSPYDPSSTGVTSTTVFPRSASPSGFSQLLSKPAKWFTRNQATSRPPTSAPSEPRSSTSSFVRKPKISHPTDLRPILPSLQSEPYIQSSTHSRSVFDLSIARAQAGVDDLTTSSPSPGKKGSTDLGDLRGLSHKPWSRSAEELGKFSASAPSTPLSGSFQDKIQQYRIGSPSHSPTTSHHPQQHPFPTFTTTSSSADLSSAPSSPVSLSPSLGTPPSGSSVPMLHVRSHSFTPKLPSKLSASKFGPPIAARKASNASERGYDTSTLAKDRAGMASPFVRGTSPFALGGGNKIYAPSPTMYDNIPAPTGDTPLLPPPRIIEPPGTGAPDSSNEKRVSQITFHSGFVNRAMDFTFPSTRGTTYGQPVVAKGWKPFKLVLRGTKLQFYKPPNDRATEIKELFPVGIVPADEEEDEISQPDEVSTDNAKLNAKPATARRRRAFWGRRTHPELALDPDGSVMKGTLEALVHEIVFATTFSSPQGIVDSVDAPQSSSHNVTSASWRDFSLSVLFALPLALGADKFEFEFVRCCTYLVSGADADAKEDNRARVAWLAEEYLRYHGKPVDEAAWNDFRRETIPNTLQRSNELPTGQSLPASASLQALYAQSPDPQSSTPGANTVSPNVGTFSPRPGNHGVMSLHEALIMDSAPTSSMATSPSRSTADTGHRPSGSGSSQDISLALLDRNGFTRDVLFRFKAQDIAHSLFIFNRHLLEGLPENLTSGDCLTSISVSIDHQVRPSPDFPESRSTIEYLLGSEAHLHWLTKLVLLHILMPDSPAGARASMLPGDPFSRTSRTYTRSEVVSTWARIGELCRVTGDECSWRAIFDALCSRPVARLDKTWRRVDSGVRPTVDNWISKAGKDPIEKKLTFWGGDTCERMRTSIDRAKVGEDDTFSVRFLKTAKDDFEEFRTAFSLCPRKLNVGTEGWTKAVETLVDTWRVLSSSEGGVSGLARKFVRIDQFMTMSLAAEPRHRGLYEPHFWTRSSNNPQGFTSASLTPLLFPEHLPYVTFIDRAQLLRGRLESGGPQQLNVEDVQTLRNGEPNFRRDGARRRSIGAPDAGSGPDFGGTTIPVFDGELVLLVSPGLEVTSSRPSSIARSRPPSSIVESSLGGTSEKTMSRAPSIRVRPGSSHGLDRKASLARRNSLPSISARTSMVIPEHPKERPVRVVVKAGTLERLVDVLAHGLPGISVSISDDNGEMPLKDGRTRDAKLDRRDFSLIWWNVFRSFVTPLVFFELLRKRYISASNVNLSSPANLVHVAHVREEIIEVLTEWLNSGGGSQDVLDDSALYRAVKSFLDSSSDHAIPESQHRDDSEVVESWKSLKSRILGLSTLFTSQTLRPNISKTPVPETQHRTTPSGSLNFVDLPDIDRTTPEELVNRINAMATAAFRNVTEEDLFTTADLLEIQSADRTAWFLPRDVSSTSEDVEIQNIYVHLAEVAQTPLISELSQEPLYRLFPPGLRSCLRAHHVLRKWIVSKIVAPRVGSQVRQARMEILLRAVEVCRDRSDFDHTQHPSLERRCVRTFVEFVLTSAILSPESRLYSRAWNNVASARRTGSDTLIVMLVKPGYRYSRDLPELITDMGWTLERMVEILSLPDVLTTPTDTSGLINFQKRRQLCDLVLDSLPSVSARRSVQRHESEGTDLERLDAIEREVNKIQFDLRAIREDVHREASHMNAGYQPKRSQRPFQRLVATQHEKNKRDRSLRDRLEKERKQEQHRLDKREEYFAKAMNTRWQYTPAQRQHRMKKSGSSTFFQQLMRPISNAFALDHVDVNTTRRTATELDFTPTGKPALVLSVVDARISHSMNYERSYTVQLDTEDGGHYLLQTATKAEMKKWIRTIDHVSKTAAKRRLTYIGNSPKPQLADHIHDRPTTASRDPTAVFGVELEFLLQREAGGAPVPPGVIPSFLEKCLLEVEARGLTEVGIYRIAGATSEVTALKDALNRGLWPVVPSTDIYAVCDLIKTWFRVLPEPAFPSYSYHDIIKAMQIEDFNTRIERIRTVIQALPRHNFDLLKRVVEHLDKVTDYEEHNQMTTDALAIVFSPNLLRAPHNDFLMIMSNMPHTNRLVKALVTHFHTIFDDADADAEVDQEYDDDEFDEPILEEEEETEEEAEASPTPQAI
ncbi:hypothetical protein EDB92DRAFT_274843 [Lactarius akahatsu]|uniref:Rho GTPase activating protein 22 n=1 Tax=Lactarius akahatsu TaxID=416441 RepID=A0AAD4LKG1_9AGAM|nr:hypothetical protein EDB92DRAFT_274843 [Lactarius akahatsu]